MTVITKRTNLRDLAGLVYGQLKKHGIEAVLTGGAVVSIYTNNKYESSDLDFVTDAGYKEIDKALNEIGFSREIGRYYVHRNTTYFVEFPSPPLSIGDMLIKKWKKLRLKTGILELLTPTQCVMDRLAAFYHWNDRQSLIQAVMVAKRQRIKIKEIEKWSIGEGMKEKFRQFVKQTKL